MIYKPLILAAIISFTLTPIVILLARKIGIIDDPRTNLHPKVIHSFPTPRGGGLAIFLSILASSFLLLPFDSHLKAILAGALVLTIMGLLDDKYNINPYVRLAVQFLAVSLPIAAGIGIAFISSPLGGIIDLAHPQLTFSLFGETRSIWLLSDILAAFWIVLLINFINMGAKGVPGQLSGVTTVAALTVAVLSTRFSADITQWPVTILAAILAGSFLGSLPFNIWPQQIMPSFSGSNLAGYMLGILSILSTTKVGTLMVVLAIPLIDTGYTIIRRVLAGKSPVWGDRGHLHHKLLDMGLSQSQVTIIYWVATAVLGFLAINLSTVTKLYTILTVVAVLGTLLLWLTYRSKSSS